MVTCSSIVSTSHKVDVFFYEKKINLQSCWAENIQKRNDCKFWKLQWPDIDKLMRSMRYMYNVHVPSFVSYTVSFYLFRSSAVQQRDQWNIQHQKCGTTKPLHQIIHGMIIMSLDHITHALAICLGLSNIHHCRTNIPVVYMSSMCNCLCASFLHMQFMSQWHAACTMYMHLRHGMLSQKRSWWPPVFYVFW